MSTSVKFITSAMRGAPALNGQSGSLIGVLDALFLTGWGVTTPLAVNVSGGIATATLNSGETFDREAVILTEGATPSALNGEARVLTSSLTSITWATTAADGAATGAITIKYAPQSDWVKAFGATNKAAYHSTHPQASGHFLRVDDTGTTTARVRGYETMSDIDTGTGPFPTDAQFSGGGHLVKSSVASAAAVKYRVFCDERFVIFAISPAVLTSPTYLAAPPRGFGDPIALSPSGDVWASMLSASTSSLTQSGNGSLTRNDIPSTLGFTAMARALSGLGGSVFTVNLPYIGGSASQASGSDSSMGVAPSEVDGRIKITTMFSRENAASKPPRADIPGILYIPQTGVVSLLSDGDILTGGGGSVSSRSLMMVADVTGTNPQTTASAGYLVDITGPWR